jgi:hypothetical protein
MMKLHKKLAVSAAGIGLLLNAAIPALASTEIIISGNGAGASDFVTVNQNSTTQVNQSNYANVDNYVEAEAETGENSASFNTGGSTAITTGAASTTAIVANKLNANVAEVECCDAGDTKVAIKENGAYSDNVVELKQNSQTLLDQENKAFVDNVVKADAETGENEASLNTGGDTVIKTGKASTLVGVSTIANANVAHISPAHGEDGKTDVSLEIIGNGALSSNWIRARLNKLTDLDQHNWADVDNYVKAESETGENEAGFNTGGEVVIMTGAADTEVGVDNMVNFNHASVDCGCAYGLLAKIAGNGADPFDHNEDGADNTILVALDSANLADQGNGAHLDNVLKDDAETGENKAKLNVGEAGDDPSIVTGPASTLVGVSNSGNVNKLGTGFSLPWSMPEVEFGWSFDWLVGFWHWAMSS